MKKILLTALLLLALTSTYAAAQPPIACNGVECLGQITPIEPCEACLKAIKTLPVLRPMPCENSSCLNPIQPLNSLDTKITNGQKTAMLKADPVLI